MKRTITTIIFFVIVLPSFFYGQTHLLEITENTTWALANSPIILPTAEEGEISVYIEGAILTIEQGVVIKAGENDKIVVGENGSIMAWGSVEDMILFTSKDETHREPEKWDGIIFEENSGREYPESSTFNNVIFQYGSKTEDEGVVTIANNVYIKVEFNNCSFRSNRIGIKAQYGGDVIINNCQFNGNTNGAIVIENAAEGVIRNCNFYSNQFALRAMENYPDTLEGNIYYNLNQKIYLPNVINEEVTLPISGNIESTGEIMPYTLGFNADFPSTIIERENLSINPGVIITASDFGDVKSSIIINDGSDGIFINGTEELPVIFTTESSTKTWGGIIQDDYTTLWAEYARFENAADTALIIGNSTYNTITNSIFINNNIGIGLNNSITLSNCVFENNKKGIVCKDDSNLEIINCKFANNDIGIEAKDRSNVSMENSEILSSKIVGLYLDNTDAITIKDSKIEMNNYGIYCELANLYYSRIEIRNTNIRNNFTGILADLIDGSEMEIYNCNFAGNIDYAIENVGSVVVSATNNWWGDKTGPFDDSDIASDPTGLYNPDGLGSEVTDYVDYSSWFDFYISDIPNIMAVVDVPNDQGRNVFVGWSSSQYDQMDSELSIVKYSVWRKLPIESKNITEDISSKSSSISNKLQNEMDEDFFEFIGDVTPLPELNVYIYTAPTLGDSNSYGVFYSTFMLVAHTEDPKIYFKSELRSGYSIDNIEPGVPSGLSAETNSTSVALVWNRNMEEDFAYYSIYKNDELLTTTADTLFVDSEVLDGEYSYKITAVDINGNESNPAFIDAIVGVKDEVFPKEYTLKQNYPNPFNPSTTIKYSIPINVKGETANVKLVVYDILGGEVATLVNEIQQAGNYEIVFEASSLSSGLYYYRISAGDFVDVKKMLLLK